MTTGDLLQQGIAALKAGRRMEARRLLGQAVLQDRNNEMAWLWLSAAVETARERRICLENALAINPVNAAAKKELEALLSKEGVVPATTPPRVSEQAPTPPVRPTPSTTVRKPDTTQTMAKKAARRQAGLVASLALGGLAIVVIAAISLWYGVSSGLLKPGSRNLSVADPTQTTQGTAPSQSASALAPVPTWTSVPRREGDTPTPQADTEGPFLADPRAYVLTLQDMPSGFSYSAEGTGPVSNEQVAESRENADEFLARLEEWGRVAGYMVAYERPGSGTSYVEIWVATLETPEGAHAYLEHLSGEMLEQGGKHVSAPSLADESSAFVFTDVDDGGYEWIRHEIRFRKHNVLGGVLTAARSGSADFDDAIDLARKLEKRITDPPPLAVVPILPTPKPTLGPSPTRTPTSTPLPVVVRINETKKLGPIWNSDRDEEFSVQITLGEAEFRNTDGSQSPKVGYVYVIVHVTIRNLGPDPMRSVGKYDFQMRDAEGALRDTEWLRATEECDMDLVDLGPGGSVSGCMGFEVPAHGKLELIYAPYKYEGLKEGRYVSFTIRP